RGSRRPCCRNARSGRTQPGTSASIPARARFTHHAPARPPRAAAARHRQVGRDRLAMLRGSAGTRHHSSGDGSSRSPAQGRIASAPAGLDRPREWPQQSHSTRPLTSLQEENLDMADAKTDGEKTQPQRSRTSARGAGSGGSGGEDVRKKVEEAHASYLQILAEGQKDIQKRYADAGAAYARDLQAVYADLQERSAEAFRTYVEATSSAVQGEAMERCVEAYRTYLEELQQFWSPPEVRSRLEEA